MNVTANNLSRQEQSQGYRVSAAAEDERQDFRSEVWAALGAAAQQTLASTHYPKIYPPTWAPVPSFP